MMLTGDLNASVSECLHGIFGPYGLEGRTGDNSELKACFICMCQ